MNEYLQPDFYKFSEDSVQLARFVVEDFKGRSLDHLLDIGAGCGVIGIEILRNLKLASRLTCIEFQEAFNLSLHENLTRYLDINSFEVINSSIGDYVANQSFDCIVCNPPYFNPLDGKPSPNRQRQISRSLEIDSLEVFLSKIIKLKTQKGRAYVVFPSSHEIFLDFGFKENKVNSSVSIYALT